MSTGRAGCVNLCEFAAVAAHDCVIASASFVWSRAGEGLAKGTRSKRQRRIRQIEFPCLYEGQHVYKWVGKKQGPEISAKLYGPIRYTERDTHLPCPTPTAASRFSTARYGSANAWVDGAIARIPNPLSVQLSTHSGRVLVHRLACVLGWHSHSSISSHRRRSTGRFILDSFGRLSICCLQN